MCSLKCNSDRMSPYAGRKRGCDRVPTVEVAPGVDSMYRADVEDKMRLVRNCLLGLW